MTINFFRGLRASYNAELHGSGIYFATDTLEIIHNGQSYSGLLEVGKSVKDIALSEGVMTVTYTDLTTTTIEVGSGKYQSNIEDETIAMTTAYGDFKAGTTVNSLNGKTYDELFDGILFPTVTPTFTAPTASIAWKNYATTQEIGSAGPTASNFTTGYNAGAINLNGKKQNNRGGAHDADNSFIYVNGSTSNKTFPSTVALGSTKFKYRAAFEEGPQPKDNKGNDYSTPLAAGTVDSSEISVNGTYPWYASTSSASTASPVVKQALVAWNSTAGAMSTGEFETKPSGTLPQVFKVPREAASVQIYDNGSGKWVTEALATTYTKTTETITINGNERTYYVYTYNASTLGNRGAAKLIVKF